MASKTLAVAVERQSGACRALAISLHDHAENSPFVGPAEREILVGYADQIAGISEALTKALKDDDRIALAAIWKWAAPAAGLAMAVTLSVTEGVAGGAAEAWTAEKVKQRAGEVQDADNEDAHLLDSAGQESDVLASADERPLLIDREQINKWIANVLKRNGITRNVVFHNRPRGIGIRFVSTPRDMRDWSLISQLLEHPNVLGAEWQDEGDGLAVGIEITLRD